MPTPPQGLASLWSGQLIVGARLGCCATSNGQGCEDALMARKEARTQLRMLW